MDVFRRAAFGCPVRLQLSDYGLSQARALISCRLLIALPKLQIAMPRHVTEVLIGRQ
jgi:hypothetical protein